MLQQSNNELGMTVSKRDFLLYPNKYLKMLKDGSLKEIGVSNRGVSEFVVTLCTHNNVVTVKEDNVATVVASKEDRLSIARKALEDLKDKEFVPAPIVDIKCYQCKSRDIHIQKTVKGKIFALCKECYEAEVCV